MAVVLVSIVLGGPMLASITLPVQSAAANSSYAVAQGTTCSVVSPIGGVDENVSSFYDYRNPYTRPSAPSYSSYGTTDIQVHQGSVIVFYEGPAGTSIVLVHDQLGDEAGGSTTTFRLSGLPDGDWAAEDDEYPGRDDGWETGGSDAEIDWKWGPNRTDGGAYRGLDEMDTTIVIDARFNEEADHWGDWGYSGSDEHRMTSWTLVDGDETAARSLALDRRVFVHHGECEVTPPSAAVDGPETTQTETNVTLDASATTDDGAIGGYEWDVDGDGEVDEITTGATTTHVYDSAGTYTVSVTAFDTYGNGDTASTTIEVEQPDTPPDASLTAPDITTVNESVTLNASASTDEGAITAYEWDVDGDGTFEENTTTPTLDHTYTRTGDYTATVRVTDDSNQTSTDSATVSVREPNQPPDADLSAPDTTIQGEGITLDASGSSDDREIAEFRWDFDGDGSVDLATGNETVEHSYQETGTVTPTVTVVDSDGATDTVSATVEVEAPETPPTAALTAPETVAVDESVTLDASASSDEGTIVEYRWDLDGSGAIDRTTTEATISHSYSSTGNVSPTVTVVDDNGTTDSASVNISVQNIDTPPSAALSTPATVLVNDSVTLDASGSSDDSAISTYAWDFEGDGTIDDTTTEPTVTHTYTSVGEVEPTVTAVDSANQSGTASSVVNVTEPVDLQPDIAISPSRAKTDDAVSFDATGSQPDDRITSYEWTYGDGATGTGATATHSYGDAGDHTVRLRVTTDAGQTATTTTTVSIAARSSGGGAGGGAGGGGSGAGGGTPRSDDGADGTTPAPQPNVSAVSVSAESRTLVEGETFVVDATVTNHGNGTGTKTIEFNVEGTIVNERTFSLESNETRTVTFTHRFTSPGNKTIQIDYGEKFEVRVVPAAPDMEVTSLRADPASAEVGQDITFSVAVSNVGHAEGSRTIELQLFGETVGVGTVTLGPGEETTVTFTRAIDAPGTYEAVVDSESVEVSVTEQDETTTTRGGDESRASTPGFGLFAALTAVILVVVILGRRS